MDRTPVIGAVASPGGLVRIALETRMSLRVLLADDSPAVRHGGRPLLEQACLAVVCEAADGQEAVELWRAYETDVAILDFCMPRLTALKVARELRRGGADPAVVILTLYVEEPRIVAALEAGARGFVEKKVIPRT
jgi:DNA-binding NarL/FixJ family response regulator